MIQSGDIDFKGGALSLFFFALFYMMMVIAVLIARQDESSGRQIITRRTLFFAAAALLSAFIALFIDNQGENPRFDDIERLFFASGVLLIIFSLGRLIYRWWRQIPRRFPQIVLFGSSGALVAFAAVMIPTFAVYNTLPNAPAAAVTPDPELTGDPCDILRLRSFVDRLAQMIGEETGIAPEEVYADITQGDVVFQTYVADHGGDPLNLTQPLKDLVLAQVQQDLAAGCVGAFQASITTSQIDSLIPVALASDLNTLENLFGFEFPTE